MQVVVCIKLRNNRQFGEGEVTAMGSTCTEIQTLHNAIPIRQNIRLVHHHVLGMGEIKGEREILRISKRQFYIVVEFRSQFGITHLVVMGIDIGSERVELVITWPFNTSGIGNRSRDGLSGFSQGRTGVAKESSRKYIEITFFRNGIRSDPIAERVGVFTPESQFNCEMLTKLLTCCDICSRYMFAIIEIRRRLADYYAIQ